MPNLGYKIRHKEGYFPVAPADTQQDIRTEMCLTMEELGVADRTAAPRSGHRPARPKLIIGSTRWSRRPTAMMVYKYVVKNVARKHGKTASFMPKPLFGDNGSGMHTHQSPVEEGQAALCRQRIRRAESRWRSITSGGCSSTPRRSARICNPTTNSYKRLVPGYEAPVNLAYSARNRSAAIRIPTYSENPKAKRLEYRPPDPAANPYLAFAALLMAGLDGI